MKIFSRTSVLLAALIILVGVRVHGSLLLHSEAELKVAALKAFSNLPKSVECLPGELGATAWQVRLAIGRATANLAVSIHEFQDWL